MKSPRAPKKSVPTPLNETRLTNVAVAEGHTEYLHALTVGFQRCNSMASGSILMEIQNIVHMLVFDGLT